MGVQEGGASAVDPQTMHARPPSSATIQPMDSGEAKPEGPGNGDGAVPVFTIGYGSRRTAEEFIELIGRYGVKYLVDVRTKPYSKFRPEFSKEAIGAIARRAGIVYVFMGDTLGGLPGDTSCYIDGKVDYTLVRDRDWFKSGIDRVEAGWKAGHCLAMMCAELEPERCHRSKLLGEALIARGVPMGHIDEGGGVLTQQAVLDRLTDGQGALFDTGLTSRKKYRPAVGSDEGIG